MAQRLSRERLGIPRRKLSQPRDFDVSRVPTRFLCRAQKAKAREPGLGRDGFGKTLTQGVVSSPSVSVRCALPEESPSRLRADRRSRRGRWPGSPTIVGWHWGFLVLCGALLVPSLAGAQQADDASRSAARAIGTAGVEAFQHGDYAAANDRLEKAYRVLRVPSLGLWSARALAKAGRLVAASERYRETMQLDVSEGNAAIQKQAQADASSDLDALVPRIPSVVIQVEGLQTGDLVLSLDGSPVSSALVGERRPVDPGKHVIEAHQGDRRANAEVVLAEGETKTVALSLQAGSAGASASGSPTSTTDLNPPATDSGSHPNKLGPQKTAALVAAGLGVVGVVVGAVFGLDSKSDHDQSNTGGHCTGNVCDKQGLALSNSARSAGNVSTVAFIVGAAGLAGGSVLWFTAKHQEPSAAQVGLGFGTVQLRGHW
jgi:hypothetical protein